MTELLARLNHQVDELEASVQGVQATWTGLLEPLERLSDDLGRTWGIVQHLKVSSFVTWAF